MHIIAPYDIIPVVDFYKARVIGIADRIGFSVLILPGNYMIIDLKDFSVFTASKVNIGSSVPVIGAEDSHKFTVIGQYSAVVYPCC